MIVPDEEISFEFVRSSGPGGQNVNKVATAVRLRFDVAASRTLADEVKERLLALAGRRATAQGEILLLGQRHRTQEKNRQDVLERLEELVQRALVPPRRRRATKVPAGAREHRLEEKRRRARRKIGRSSTPDAD